MVGFNFSYGIYYLMVKMAIIFHIPESEIIRTYFHVVRFRSHEIVSLIFRKPFGCLLYFYERRISQFLKMRLYELSAIGLNLCALLP